MQPMIRHGGVLAAALLFWMLLGGTKHAVIGAKSQGDNKLADMEEIFSTPALDWVEDASVSRLSQWYTMWRNVLHVRIDGLVSALEDRAATLRKRAAENVSKKDASPLLDVMPHDDRGFKIAMVGDSTVRMQAHALAFLLRQRNTTDGQPQCYSASHSDNLGVVDLRCKGSDGNNLFSVDFTKVFTGCVTNDVDAHFVYFGCGFHILHLFPERALEKTPMDRWVHYQRVLEEAVQAYRAGNGTIGEAFMTTHSFAEEQLDGAYKTQLQEYVQKNETVLANCRAKVMSLTVLHPEWENEFPREAICTNGLFAEAGVVELNRRAEAVMLRLGVPIVPGYDITRGQIWATARQDGRHYPPLVPMELSSVLSEISQALERERLSA